MRFICLSLLVIGGLLTEYVLSVDRNNFKTCEQSSFCRRCRKMEPGKSIYEMDLDSVQMGETFQARLINTENQVKFILTLYPLVGKTMRLRVIEEVPLRPRFEPPFILVKEPQLDKFELIQKTSHSIELKYSSYKVEILTAPFILNVYSGSEIIVSANARGLMRFEHTRTKPEERDENEDPGAWEENFKSHQDTKPHGPTAVALDFSFPGAKAAYGLPEHADSLALKTTTGGDPYRFYNLDVFEYELDNPMALYAAIPYLIAHSEQQSTGVFWLNPSETWVDVVTGSTNVVSTLVNFVAGSPKPQIDAHFMSESGNIDVFINLGPKPHDLFKQYTDLTGHPNLPPYFSLGYHQCRWNYNDQDDVNAVSIGFDNHDIPMDVMWLDIEHTDGKKYFTWDPYKFPNPIEMQANLTARGRKLVVIVDPHIKRDPEYFLHNDATNNGYYVKNKDNNDYEGWCWPGSSSYLDFLNPTVRDYYSSRYKLQNYIGSTENLHIWNDMNEPSVFNGPEVTMPKDNIHFGGWEHREIHNMYGFLQTMSTYEGMLHRSDIADLADTQRPFILTRSAFAGSQRFTAIWTGDNFAEWSHLAASISMCLSLATSGMAFCGADVGGFFKNPEKELFIRWYQTGAFLPFFRSHAHIDTKRREPWLFDGEALTLIRAAIKKRYSYLPYWYTLFYQQNATGTPVIRPLWAEFPEDENTFQIDDSFTVGNGLLLKPVTSPGTSKLTVYFPGSKTTWYDIDTYETFSHGNHEVSAPINKIPVFQRGGTIIPRMLRIRRSSSLMMNDPMSLVVILDENGKASGHLYLDDGVTHRYLHKPDSLAYVELTFLDNVLSSKPLIESEFKTHSWLERVEIIGLKTPIGKVADVISGGMQGTVEVRVGDNKVVYVRKPAVKMSDEWRIQLH